MTRKKELAAHLVAFLTIVVWGTTFVSTKILLESFTPMQILFHRFAIGYIILWIAHPRFAGFRGWRSELLFLGAGICGITLYFLFENVALTYTSAANVSIIVSVAPMLTALLAHFLLPGERLKPRFFIGFLFAFAGIALVTFNGSVLLHLSPVGDILSFLAAVTWAGYSIFVKKTEAFGFHILASTRKMFFYGLLLMIPCIYFGGPAFPSLRFNPEDLHMLLIPVNLFNTLYLAVGASALCFVTWNWAMGKLGAVKTSLYIYLVPVIAVIGAFFILREPVTLMGTLGGLLAIAGLYISETGGKRAKKQTDDTKPTKHEQDNNENNQAHF